METPRKARAGRWAEQSWYRAITELALQSRQGFTHIRAGPSVFVLFERSPHPRVVADTPALARHDRGEKPPRGVGSEPGDRQDWQRISGKMRRKSMPVLSVPGALVGGDEVSMAVFHELSRAEGPSQQTTKGDGQSHIPVQFRTDSLSAFVLDWTRRFASAMVATKTKATEPAFNAQAFLAKVGSGRTLANHSAGEIVFSQGDAADSIFYVRKGRVKLTVISRQGKEAVIAMLGAGDFFGEGCLAGQTRRMATCRTMSPSSLARLEKVAAIRVLHEEPVFSELFLRHLLARSIRIEEDLVDQLFNSSEKRLARVLLLLANFGKEGEPQTVIAKISQETLAGIVGTTRSRVSFFMNKFRKLGFIAYNGHLEVPSSLLTAVLHD